MATFAVWLASTDGHIANNHIGGNIWANTDVNLYRLARPWIGWRQALGMHKAAALGSEARKP
jgi:hypothetical protein